MSSSTTSTGTGTGTGNLPIPADAADALAAVLAHSERIDAEERGLVLAIAKAADTYRVDETVIDSFAERLLYGGADGTPKVSEYLCLELGGLLRCSPCSAANRIAGVLNVRHRHPNLWQAFLTGRVRWWHADKVALACAQAGLDAAAAAWVDAQVAAALMLQPVNRVLAKVDGLIVKADPALAAQRAEQAAGRRHVTVDRVIDGHTDLWGRLNAADGIALDQALDQIADTLPGADPRQTRRATALGLLARSVFGQDTLPTSSPTTPADGSRPTDTPAHAADAPPLPAALGVGLAHPVEATTQNAVFGSSEVEWADEPPEEDDDERPTLAGLPLPRQPRRAQLIIRLDGAADHTATIQDRGVLLTGQLADILAGCHVTIRPVIVPADLPAEDGYRPSAALRLAVAERDSIDLFPYGTIPAAGADLDHTVPYNHHAPPLAGQTRYDNLATMFRRAHRGKTHGGWHLAQPQPGLLHWACPGGYEYLVDDTGTILIKTPTRTPRHWTAHPRSDEPTRPPWPPDELFDHLDAANGPPPPDPDDHWMNVDWQHERAA